MYKTEELVASCDIIGKFESIFAAFKVKERQTTNEVF